VHIYIPVTSFFKFIISMLTCCILTLSLLIHSVGRSDLRAEFNRMLPPTLIPFCFTYFLLQVVGTADYIGQAGFTKYTRGNPNPSDGLVYNSHHPSPLTMLTRPDRSCSPKHSKYRT
uniref:Uncharacterized protein n=1 Tax=Varanus komodoensis TaxID=61221 RepID=A0A8D2Q3I0_VARKO